MRGKRLSAILMSFLLAGSLCACGDGGKNNGDGNSSVISEFEGLPEIRFASFYGSQGSGSCKLKMRVPFDDEFNVSFTSKIVKKVTIMDENGNRLISSQEPFDIELKQDRLVYMDIEPAQDKVKVEVTAKEHASQLPFDIEGAPDISQFSTTSASADDPLEAAEIEAKKRNHGLYIYSNSPESVEPECLNKALTRNDVSNEEVFFTYEHNSNKIPTGMFYGYQVLNTGTEDAYITVKNVGMQVSGAGTFYGEAEWTAFYNTKFELPDMSGWSTAEKDSYKAWYAFSGSARNPKYQPVTYRVPAGKYIYVLGGTTDDAFNGYNVGATANKRVTGSCQNGAVLFEVIGQAEAMFYVYDDPSKVGADNKTHEGLSVFEPNTNNGWDTGAVVDTSAVWTFNDNTPSQDLPVTFTNYYVDTELDEDGNTIAPAGEPFSKIPVKPHVQNLTTWQTHSNVHSYHESLGTDMTAFHTRYDDKESVIVGCEYYDARGRLANIGNWMKDYIDTYTFVNQGDNARDITVTIKPIHGGGLTVLARDESGKMIPGSEKFSLYYPSREYGDPVEGTYSYTFSVAAHSVRQISFEYNLMANSYGTVAHTVTLA